MPERENQQQGNGNETARLRTLVAIAGAVYLVWWFMVELLLPGSFNPLPGRLIVVALVWVLLAASYRIRWVERHLSGLFTAWACLLVAHYSYLIVGNHGETTWWVGAFVTFATVSMCMQSRHEVAAFSLFALSCVLTAAATEDQLASSIYVPGLATILLLANITKRSQVIAHDAMLQAANARNASLKSDEQRFQLAAIVEFSGDAIIASTLDGLIQSFNKAAERLFGYDEAEVIGRPLSLLLPAGHEAEEPVLVARLARGETVVPIETVRRRRDGSPVDISVTMSPIRDSRGELIGVSWAARDISEWKRVQLEVLRAREAAEAANRELEAFSYSVAHDLRAPLRSIDGFSNALLEDHGPELGPVAHDYLQRVQRNAKLMGQLIDALLELGRITRADISVRRVDLSELARATAERLKEFEPNRAVEFLIDDGLAEHGDSALLGAVIENLFSNAWKFTRNRSNARIEFGSTRDSGKTIYFVRDNGAGFNMGSASRLFRVFQRLHSQEEFDGTGVGLATVHRIVQRHGGRIWAEGKVGEGASFHFTFDRAADRPR
ncbi:MAG TPA: PAS domain S-box protein [Polyangiales bacterium]|nr:PAS domain S-box protein [Polyangiales bacterium]